MSSELEGKAGLFSSTEVVHHELIYSSVCFSPAPVVELAACHVHLNMYIFITQHMLFYGAHISAVLYK